MSVKKSAEYYGHHKIHFYPNESLCNKYLEVKCDKWNREKKRFRFYVLYNVRYQAFKFFIIHPFIDCDITSFHAT